LKILKQNTLAQKIKFGTDGWRAIIADEFTVENVARVAIATGNWTKQNYEKPSIVIGHDCRFAGELFVETDRLQRGQRSNPYLHLAKTRFGRQ
jgi:phosphomannomutase